MDEYFEFAPVLWIIKENYARHILVPVAISTKHALILTVTHYFLLQYNADTMVRLPRMIQLQNAFQCLS